MVNLIYEQLQDNIREGKKVDKPLTNWFLLTFVLSWLTLGIALVYTFIKRILRVDKYIRRKSEYFDIVIHFIEVESNERGLDDYENIMNRLKTRLQEFKNTEHYIMPYFIKAFIPLIIFTIFLALFVLLTGIGNIENYLLIHILFPAENNRRRSHTCCQHQEDPAELCRITSLYRFISSI